MVTLTKGQKVSLKKEAPGLKKILVGLGWDPAITLFGADIDIDASVICIDKNGKRDNIIYYGKLTGYSHAVEHYGDNLTGEGDGDDEQIEIALTELPKKVERLSIIINIYSAFSRKQHFGKVKNCFVHVTDMNTGKELVRYNVNGDYNKMTGIFVADIYRADNGWTFEALGEGCRVKNIEDMVRIKCE